MIKEPIHQADMAFLNTYIHLVSGLKNNKKQKLTALKGEMDKALVIVVDFSIPQKSTESSENQGRRSE